MEELIQLIQIEVAIIIDLLIIIYRTMLNPVGIIILLAIAVLLIVGWWNMFEKAGYEGWKCLIPLYSSYVKYEMAFGEERGLLFLVSYIPSVGPLFSIIFLYKTAKAFGKGVGYTAGLLFLQPVFVILLGRGSALYEGVY